jgi:putative endonuclease
LPRRAHAGIRRGASARNARFGGAAASITATKQRRLILAAQHYLAGKSDVPCRFDCVLLDALDPARVDWLRNAFDAG